MLVKHEEFSGALTSWTFRIRSGADFWELYRRLGECYEAHLKSGEDYPENEPMSHQTGKPKNHRLKSAGLGDR